MTRDKSPYICLYLYINTLLRPKDASVHPYIHTSIHPYTGKRHVCLIHVYTHAHTHTHTHTERAQEIFFQCGVATAAFFLFVTAKLPSQRVHFSSVSRVNIFARCPRKRETDFPARIIIIIVRGSNRTLRRRRNINEIEGRWRSEVARGGREERLKNAGYADCGNNSPSLSSASAAAAAVAAW